MTYQTLLKYALQWGVAVALGTISAVSTAADHPQGATVSPVRDPVIAQSRITYKPPLSDDSRDAINGSARDTSEETTGLQVLAPDHVGITTQSQPTLYWYTSTPRAVRLEVTRIDKGKTRTLLKVEPDSNKVAGIQQLDLGEHNISLQPGVVYQWSVALVTDESSPLKKLLSRGDIKRIEPGEGLTSRIKRSKGTRLANVYASEGIWYDALQTISSMIDKSPEDKGLVAIRRSLLEQAGLNTATGTPR
jgi:hypothetical protein